MSRLQELAAARKAPPAPPAPPKAPVRQAPAAPIAPRAPVRQAPVQLAPQRAVERERPAFATAQPAFQEVQLVELKPIDHANESLNTIEGIEKKVSELLATGANEALVAIQCGVTLSKVFEVRRGSTTTTMVNRTAIGVQNQQTPSGLPSPKEVFSRRMRDFDECLEIAIAEYKNDPDSESNYNAMNGFMKTMKDLFEAYQDLDDPQEVAEKIVKQIIYPYMSGTVKTNVNSFRSIIEDMSPTMVTDFQREQFRDGLKDALRKIEENTRNEFNRAIKTLEAVFQASLTSLYMRPQGSVAATALENTTEVAKREAA